MFYNNLFPCFAKTTIYKSKKINKSLFTPQILTGKQHLGKQHLGKQHLIYQIAFGWWFALYS